MMWLVYVLLAVLFVVGVVLMPPKGKNVMLHIIFFPIAWLLAILTFPVHYFRQMFYTKKEPQPEFKAIRIRGDEDFMIKMVKKSGEEVVIKPFEEDNKDVSVSKK